MKLTRIISRGLKGSDFDLTLTPATILFGGNFRGKTRVMDAIRLALLGYLPELGKNNRDTFGLASGPEMEVVAEFDTGLRIRRRWMLKGNAVTKDEDVPEAVKAWGDLNVMLNAEEYFALSDRARVDYVAMRCATDSEMSATGIINRLKKTLLVGHKGEEVDKFLTKLRETEGIPSIDGRIEVVAALWKEAKAAATRAEKTIQQLTDMRLRDEPTTPIAVLETRRVALTRGLADLNERKGRLIGSFTQMQADRRRREEIERENRFGDKNRQQLVDLQNKLAMLRTELAAPCPGQDVLTKLWTEASNAKNLVANLGAEADRQKKAKERAEKLLAEMDGHKVCPYCGASGDGWKALNAAELATGIAEAEENMVLALSHRAVAQTDYELALHEHGIAQTAVKQRQALVDSEAEVLREIARLEPTIARLAGMTEELVRLMPDNPLLTAEVETVQTEINVKGQDIRVVEAEIKAVNGRQFELTRLANAEKERDDAKLEAEVAAAAGKELRVIQGEMVADAFKPLLTRANSFFGGVLKSPLAYNAKEGGEIGSWRDGLWVGHRTFSGTEKALTYAAIQAALAMTSPFKLMLLDELGRLDDRSAALVLDAVCQAIHDGLIDGMVGIDTGRGDLYRGRLDANPGLQVIEIQ